jgi:phosphopentomutase
MRLAALHGSHALTLFEYFHTDKLGHGRLDMPPGVLLGQLDAFFGTLLDALDPKRDTLLVTSDHGNLEALGQKTHTRNPVPLLAYGWAAPFFASATDLRDVAPAIVAALQQNPAAASPA